MTDDRLWNHALVIAQKLGRRVSCSTQVGSRPTTRLETGSNEQVLPGEIVHL